jgi:penicillin-binding protein 2
MPDDRRNLSMRLSVLQYVTALAFASLAVAFWVFQVAQHGKFQQMADNNHMRRLPLPAPRGMLFDRHMQLLVENRNTYNISLVREQSRNLDETLRILAAATGVDEVALRENLDRRRRDPSYRPIVLIEDATDEQVTAMMARKLELPGIFYQDVPTRRYPGSELGAHLFGYVSEINEAQLTSREYAGIEAGSVVGQAGVEKAYNRMLMGADGERFVVVNSRGREMNELGQLTVDPKEGRRLQLTIDKDVQRASEEGFQHFGYNGAAVILDPRTGEVLSLVSLPAYDPNQFAVGIDGATWRGLTTDKLKPLQNRALQGKYSPGSTFKIVVATAALEEGLVTPSTGSSVLAGRRSTTGSSSAGRSADTAAWTCGRPSRNPATYFYTLGNMLGVDRIHKWRRCSVWGVQRIDLPNEVKGSCPRANGSCGKSAKSGTRVRPFRSRSARASST